MALEQRPPGGHCGACKTPKDCSRDNFCFRRDNAERAARAVERQPQPVKPPPVPEAFHRISALRVGGKWKAEVYGGNKIGSGFAVKWLDAVNAAIEDLKEKE